MSRILTRSHLSCRGFEMLSCSYAVLLPFSCDFSWYERHVSFLFVYFLVLYIFACGGDLSFSLYSAVPS
jgi:hypothetical protein